MSTRGKWASKDACRKAQTIVQAESKGPLSPRPEFHHGRIGLQGFTLSNVGILLGTRILTDLLAIPFRMGPDKLCVYSAQSV